MPELTESPDTAPASSGAAATTLDAEILDGAKRLVDENARHSKYSLEERLRALYPDASDAAIDGAIYWAL